MPTLAAIQAGTSIALANKETLVSAGSIVMKAAKDRNVPILAVDSEHSAILQCLSGETPNSIEKLILTASGGPFRTLPHDEFSTITVEKALKHPNWVMGSKITIDSSTLMNKGFEVIEAHYLFDISIEHIEVIIHPQSIIHSMIQFTDGSIKAQLGTPDMRIPIMYALFYPEHKPADLPRLDLISMGDLSFQKPDIHKFPCLALAYQALSIGGIAPATINAANEIAVQAFLKKHISFNQIPQSIEYTLHKMPIIHQPSINDISHADTEARRIAAEFLHYIAS
jgi:1-deoxy-D-xylulose-5-phosphate reductoisomerase